MNKQAVIGVLVVLVLLGALSLSIGKQSSVPSPEVCAQCTDAIVVAAEGGDVAAQQLLRQVSISGGQVSSSGKRKISSSAGLLIGLLLLWGIAASIMAIASAAKSQKYVQQLREAGLGYASQVPYFPR